MNTTSNVTFDTLNLTGNLLVEGFQTLGLVTSGGLSAGDLNMSGILFVGEDVLINNNLFVNNFVGIGTSTPDQTLTVNGNINATAYHAQGSIGLSGTCISSQTITFVVGIMVSCTFT